MDLLPASLDSTHAGTIGGSSCECAPVKSHLGTLVGTSKPLNKGFNDV